MKVILRKKKFLGFALGGSFGFGLPWLMLKREPLMAFLAVGGWLLSCVVMWFLFERERVSRDRSE